MYHHLQGKITSALPGKIVLETGGIGYEILTPLSTSGKIKIGEEILLLVHLAVREDALTLYGFLLEDERRLFRKLITLSGIGATTALQILSAISPNEFMVIIEKQDAALLKKIKGIGEKTAKRIILELKGAKMNLPPDAGNSFTNEAADAVRALETLGMSNKEAVAKVEAALQIAPTASLEVIVATALKNNG